MKLEDQVVSLELAKKLKSLNVKQESQLYWTNDDNGNRLVHKISGDTFNVMDAVASFVTTKSVLCSAFTVAELGEMLPTQIASHRVEDADPFYWISWARDRFNRGHVQSQDAVTEADARAKMLIYLIEQGLVKL